MIIRPICIKCPADLILISSLPGLLHDHVDHFQRILRVFIQHPSLKGIVRFHSQRVIRDRTNGLYRTVEIHPALGMRSSADKQTAQEKRDEKPHFHSVKVSKSSLNPTTQYG